MYCQCILSVETANVRGITTASHLNCILLTTNELAQESNPIKSIRSNHE